MKPNKKVRKAIESYYCNCSLQAIQKWDKDGDLDNIFKEALDQGFIRAESCSGTFWFSYQTPNGKTKVITTSGKLYPEFPLYRTQN